MKTSIYHRLGFVFFIFLLPKFAIADQCPSPQTIKERKISRDYEWTIDERRTLEDVLAVEKLYSVRIKNQGEFIACHYSGSRGLLRLDGKPGKENCLLEKDKGEWDSTNTELICTEQNLDLCRFIIRCQE